MGHVIRPPFMVPKLLWPAVIPSQIDRIFTKPKFLSWCQQVGERSLRKLSKPSVGNKEIYAKEIYALYGIKVAYYSLDGV